MQRPLFIGARHVFYAGAGHYLDNVVPDGRLTDQVKIAESIHKKCAELRETNFAPPLRTIVEAYVCNRDVEFFSYAGTDAGVKLHDFLADHLTKHVGDGDGVEGQPFWRSHPAMFIGFDVEDVLAISAMDTRRARRNTDYWVWNSDHRRPNWFLDPYRHLVSREADRKVISRNQLLSDLGWRGGFDGSAKHMAETARHLTFELGLCL